MSMPNNSRPAIGGLVALDVDTLAFTAQPPGTAHNMEVQQDAKEIQARPRAQ